MSESLHFSGSFLRARRIKKAIGRAKPRDQKKDDFTYSKDDRFRPIGAEFFPHFKNKFDRITKRKGIPQAEALEQLVVEDLELLQKGEERRLEIAKAHGVPITQEDYEEQKKKQLKKHVKKDSKTD